MKNRSNVLKKLVKRKTTNPSGSTSEEKNPFHQHHVPPDDCIKIF